MTKGSGHAVAFDLESEEERDSFETRPEDVGWVAFGAAKAMCMQMRRGREGLRLVLELEWSTARRLDLAGCHVALAVPEM